MVGGLGPSLIMGSGGFRNEGRGANQGIWGTEVPQRGPGAEPRYENNCQKTSSPGLLIGQSKNNEIQGFGGRPPVGGRPGARAPAPLNPTLNLTAK